MPSKNSEYTKWNVPPPTSQPHTGSDPDTLRTTLNNQLQGLKHGQWVQRGNEIECTTPSCMHKHGFLVAFYSSRDM